MVALNLMDYNDTLRPCSFVSVTVLLNWLCFVLLRIIQKFSNYLLGICPFLGSVKE